MAELKDEWQDKRARMCDSICDILRDAGHLPPAGLDESTLLAVVRRLAAAEQAARATGEERDYLKRKLLTDEVVMEGIIKQWESLRAFKAYVHRRLDEAGVPADPDSPHKAEGCRIGGRLDLVLGEPRWIPVREKEVPSDIPVLTYRGNAWPPYMTIGSGGTSGGCSGAYVVTHWMPLPPSPVAGGPGGAERSKA